MIEAHRESTFMRAMLAGLLFSAAIRLSSSLLGKVVEQPWWGIALTVGVATAVAAFAWHNFRVYEREKIRSEAGSQRRSTSLARMS
jgi:divalent metal cation (Fe/Co/Zn/Cd) transporter